MAKRGRKSNAEKEALKVASETIVGTNSLNAPTESPKVEPEKFVDDEIILVKTTSRFVANKLIDKKATVKHISGSGQPANPKIWFIEATEKMLNELTAEEQEFVENAVKDEIKDCVDKSIVRKNEEKAVSGAQKRLPGTPITPSKYI